MVNPMILEILKRKVEAGEITVEEIKIAEYKTEITTWLTSQ